MPPTPRSRRARPARPSRRARRAGARAPSLTLRLTTRADLAVLTRHRRRMWEEIRSFPPQELDRHDVAYRRWMLEETGKGRFFGFLVQDADGRPLGSGALWLMPSQPRPGVLGRGEMPYVLSMYTEPDARGRGVATRIVREMIRWSKARHYGRLVLHASTFGRPVYERLGFVPGSEMKLELIRRPASLR